MLWTEPLGRAAGELLGPVARWMARARHARVFHPEGTVYLGELSPEGEDELERRLASHLRGPVLARFSTAWWRRGREWPDVLGCALRFVRSQNPGARPEEDDQDLLFATVRRPERTLLAPLTTHVHDYLENDYYSVAPFRFERSRSFKLRLVSPRPGVQGESRQERLEDAIGRGMAQLTLQARIVGRRKWKRIGTVSLVRGADVDQEALRFWPFRSGRGIRPTGFIQMLRLAPYKQSQANRPSRAPH